MKSSKELREAIGDTFDKAEAIMTVARDEKRELDDAERADVDAIMAEIGEERGEDGKPSGMWAEVHRAERYEKAEERIRQARSVGPQTGDSDPSKPAFEIPRAALRYAGRMKAFAGSAAKQDAYKSGLFLMSVLGHEDSQRRYQDYFGTSYQNAMGTGENTLGGALVPEEFEATVIDLKEQYGVFRGETRITPMMSDTKVVPRRKSGLTAYAVGDNDAITASDMNWNNVNLIAKTWGVLAKYSGELSDDSVISMADTLAGEMAYAFAQKEDECGFIGDGTSTYHGISGATTQLGSAGIQESASGSLAFADLTLAEFEGCVSKLPEYAEAGAKWYISRVGYWLSMANLMDALGGNTIQDLGSGPVRMFMGYPVVITQTMNAASGDSASTVKALFGNLELASTMGDRRGMSVLQSEHRYMENNQIGIRGLTRFAINVHDAGDASDAGPIVGLKTPAS